MRIIGGRHRGTKLAVLAGDKTRPTADRVRESLFNILHGGRFGTPLADGIVIDLFAGTGALGLEALSHGAAHASFVENDGGALGVLRENIARLKRNDDTAIIGGNALSIGAWRGAPANLVFADAPYGSGNGLAAVQNLISIKAVTDDALMVIETAKTETLSSDVLEASSLDILDQRKYGKAMLHFLQFN